VSKFIVSYGGGVTSAEALKRTIEKHGRENTVAVFADVGQVRDSEGRVVDGEDDDLYRFMAEVEEFLDFKIMRIKSEKYGPGIWSVFFGERCMGNTLMDPCSRALKRRPLDSFINGNFLPIAGDTRVTGLDWTEPRRLLDFEAAMAPWSVWFPLCDEPRRTKAQLILDWIGHGIEPPVMYEEGFTHNNCSGFCVKGGIWHFYNLWRSRPWVYLHHESQEELFRETVAKQTILKKQTMRELRARFEDGFVPIKRGGGCRGICVVPVKDEFKEAA
jgi:hypothetical protein